MSRPNLNPEEYFPVIKQTISDAFGVESFLLTYPYENIEQMDMGLRKMIWGDYSTSKPIFNLKKDNPYQIIIIESSLGFYNLVAYLNKKEHPDIIGLRPFLTEPSSLSNVKKVIQQNGISPTHTDELTDFYNTLPVVNMSKLTITLTHQLQFFLPEGTEIETEYLNYKYETHEPTPSEERYDQFTSDNLVEIKNRTLECIKAVTSGNANLAVEKMKHILDYLGYVNSSETSELKKALYGLNILLASHMLNTSVHPAYIYGRVKSFQEQITETTSHNELLHLPFDMARKYALLVKKYTHDNYSYLVRSIINYIDQHLESELSLADIAEVFGKNPSYISNTFKKEVGETLTTYVARERIQGSLKLFNTTTMSVADVSMAVGISDFGYFSKLFKKYVGISPREYKKLLDK